MSGPDRVPPRAVIFGCAEPSLTDREKKFFERAQPYGLILFARNVDSPAQLAALTAEFRQVVGREDAPVLIDQEGGRVTRLKEPHWRHPPPAAVFVEAARNDLNLGCRATRLNYRMIARDLVAAGISVDCAPVADIPVPGAHDIIGDRAFGAEAHMVATLGRSVCDGLMDEGVLPVIKHMPGHGRAFADSHTDLPTVEASLEDLQSSDFRPFSMLADMPWAMTAHIVFSALDPDRPATVSPRVMREIVRGMIGYRGFVLSDDICMAALSGTPAERAAAAVAAGCDAVLHCSGAFEEMEAIAAATPRLTDEALARIEHGETMKRARCATAPRPPENMAAELQRLLTAAGIKAA